MLALLFDMNTLWEEYILVQLKKACINKPYEILGQQSKPFWGNMTIRPDILITEDHTTKIVIDTKWKQMESNKPSTNDLRQMYVYNEHWQSNCSILLYPGIKKEKLFYQQFRHPDHACGVLKINVLDDNGLLDKEIGEKIIIAFKEEGFIS